jgi:hypothetical protein
MLVTFKCKASGEFSMLGDEAVRLIKMMGHSGTIPGAISAGDVPDALKNIKAAIEVEKESEENAETEDEEDEKEPPVKMAIRAYPLVEMLSAAVRDNCEVMWYQ